MIIHQTPEKVSLYYKKSKKGGSGEVATKLKDLKITKVDFVDKGANPKWRTSCCIRMRVGSLE